MGGTVPEPQTWNIDRFEEPFSCHTYRFIREQNWNVSFPAHAMTNKQFASHILEIQTVQARKRKGKFMRTNILTTLFAGSLIAAGCAQQPEPVVELPTTPEPVREVLTSDAQRAPTPEMVLADLTAGNQRFVEGRLTDRDFMAQAEATAAGQFPKAAILGCVDRCHPSQSSQSQSRML